MVQDDPVEIYMKTASGQMIPLEVCLSDSVDSVKEKIEKIENVSAGSQKISFEGAELRTGSLSDHKIVSKVTIEFIYAHFAIVALQLI